MGRVPKLRVFGVLYAVDADRWSQPLWSFRAHPTDPLAAVPPGSLVDLDRAPQRGERVEIRQAQFSFRTSTPLVPGVPQLGGRLFAEKGDIVVHPALAGPSAPWRSAILVHHPPGRWRIAAPAVGTALVAPLALAAQHGEPMGWLLGISASFALAGVVALCATAWTRWARQRARQVPRPPARRMVLRLRWVVGDGGGPVAVAQLREPGAPPEHRQRELGVVNVSHALVELDARDHDCIVHGDLARGVASIDVDGATLFPAPPPYRNIPPP